VGALGGTAGQALTGRAVKVLSERGRIARDPRGFRLLHRAPVDHPSAFGRGGKGAGVRGIRS